MRYIVKNSAPNGFENWKAQTNPKKWSDLKGTLPPIQEDGIHYYSKGELREELLQEQFQTCCYCENRIENNASQCVVEHIYPREGDSNLSRIFSYDNLAASCDGGNSLTNRNKDLHCDASKGDKILPISPHQIECEDLFNFNFNGKIEHSNNSGIDMIRILGLNALALIGQREEAINGNIYSDLECTILLSKEKCVARLTELKDQRTTSFRTAIIRSLESLI